MSDWYTWKEFCDGVKGLLTVDSNRRGAELFTEGMIRQGAIDLQDFIPAYRVGHETIYLASDFVTSGSASIATLPPEAQVRDGWMCNLDTSLRIPMRDMSWMDRMQMVHGGIPINDQNARIAIDPNAHMFFAYPAVAAPWCVSIFWDGLKLEYPATIVFDRATGKFSDNDDPKVNQEVPFDEGAMLAVADFVKGKLAREVDRDLTMYQSYFHPIQGSYTVKRKNLYLTAKARTRTQR